MSLLRIRVESLRANLDRIKDLLTKFPNRWTDWEKLQTNLKNIRESLVKHRKVVSNAKIDTDLILPEVSTALRDTEEQIVKVQAELGEVDRFIVSMRQKCFQFQQLDVWRDIAKDLDERISPRIQALNDIETGLQRSTTDLRQKWQTFSKKANEINREVFADYIEFLGGLALRDTGFDTGISKVAEELIWTYSSKRTNLDQTLAIPTRRQTVAVTLPRIIRVTFPDWTIWALPSTAHEFWNVVAKNDLNDRLVSALRTLTDNWDDAIEPQFNDCLGDAFATYTMGPAYAFFAIFLLLDPSSPFIHKPVKVADEVRAHSIFQMLESMDSKEPEIDPPYSAVRTQISRAWADAIAQTGAQPRTNEKTQIATDKSRATELVKSLWTTLKDSASPPFTVEVWNEIQQWVGPLIRGQVDEIKVPHGAELRHVLNAAWLARVSPERNPRKDITKAATDLAKKITDLAK